MERLPIKGLPIIAEFCQYLQIDCGFNPHTPRCYGSDLVQFATFLVKDELGSTTAATQDDLCKAMCNASTNNIKGFMDHLTRNGYSSATIARKVASLRTFYAWVLENKKCVSNPMKEIPTYRVKRRLQTTLSVEEVQKLLASITDTNIQGLRDKVMFELLYYAALSVEEVTMLDLDDVQLTDTEVTLTIRRRDRPKKSRSVSLAQADVQTLKHFIDSVRNDSQHSVTWSDLKLSKPLFFNKFGHKMSCRCIRRTLEKHAWAAGLRTNISPKTLRLSRGVHLTIEGWTAKEIMDFIGHRSYTSTATYNHIAHAKQNAVVA